MSLSTSSTLSILPVLCLPCSVGPKLFSDWYLKCPIQTESGLCLKMHKKKTLSYLEEKSLIFIKSVMDVNMRMF